MSNRSLETQRPTQGVEHVLAHQAELAFGDTAHHDAADEVLAVLSPWQSALPDIGRLSDVRRQHWAWISRRAATQLARGCLRLAIDHWQTAACRRRGPCLITAVAAAGRHLCHGAELWIAHC